MVVEKRQSSSQMHRFSLKKEPLAFVRWKDNKVVAEAFTLYGQFPKEESTKRTLNFKEA